MNLTKIYRAPSELGIEPPNIDLLDVIRALPNDTMFFRGNTYNDAAISGHMPPGYIDGGTLIIINSNGKHMIKYIRQNAVSLLDPPEEYIGTTENNNPITLKWYKVMLENVP